MTLSFIGATTGIQESWMPDHVGRDKALPEALIP